MAKKLEYRELLNSERWSNMRKRRFKEAEYRCSLCRLEKKILVLHHLHYDSHVGCERKKDLAVVCKKCHYMIHFSQGEKVSLSEILERYLMFQKLFSQRFAKK